MKKINNKKGFTLIELLIVLVILSIISLVLTPYVLEKINTSREKQLTSVVLSYIEGIEKDNAKEELKYVSGYYDVTLLNDFIENDKPSDGWIIIDYDGNIEAGVLEFDDILTNEIVIYYNSKTIITKYNNSYINPSEINSDSLKEIISNYYEEVSIETIIE